MPYGTINGRPFTAATQAQQEAATDNSVPVTPGTQKHHPAAAKGWVNFDGTGTPSIKASWNVASITDLGTGSYTIVWDTDFSTATYAVVATGGLVGNRVVVDTLGSGSQVATGSQVYCYNLSGTALDPTIVCVIAFGDQ